ncbi:16S rRNA (uracil(1498)-N(3))-methyltransferase [Stenomitos frigidus]|uniref:Ribosomal RNA small subunit methyltransferase E n=1 Tax=Stenomitos frigidus ULC18 TaxID=2107698 RepID=A0A2T1E9D2_9CYAN|nr:16S rRNA (uracil(1498)-N(3))-methyltransferase [Stenomitos frigidus]PSB29321.1 16S rRNA (uracil(1498)-N(3))-methyltransferase [Stenomitos frigidus ULC18]
MQLQRLVVEPGQLQNGRLLLASSQQHYLQRVLRLGEDDRFIVMDGLGHAWLATFVQSSDALVQAELLEPITTHTELPIRVTLVAALPKGNGFDDVVRQATELGVDQILPVMSDRTLLHPSAQKVERWQRIANEAAEQSERLCVPRLNAPISFSKYLQQESNNLQTPDVLMQKYLCIARGASHHLLDRLQVSIADAASPSIVIAIGPEGGWTDAEVEQAIAVGYQPVSLGARILRAVTAPLVALSLIAAVYEKRVESRKG